MVRAGKSLSGCYQPFLAIGLPRPPRSAGCEAAFDRASRGYGDVSGRRHALAAHPTQCAQVGPIGVVEGKAASALDSQSDGGKGPRIIAGGHGNTIRHAMSNSRITAQSSLRAYDGSKPWGVWSDPEDGPINRSSPSQWVGLISLPLGL